MAVCTDSAVQPTVANDAAPYWRAAWHALAQRQAALSVQALRERQESLLGPKGMFALLVNELRQLGGQAPLLGDLARLPDRNRRSQADRALLYALSHHHQCSLSANPFRGLAREYLGWAVYDEQAGFALVERYAALLSLQQQDRTYFARLVDTTRKTVERRLMYRGLVEHYDALLPIERCVYPAGYRESRCQHLAHEEALYGKLELQQPLSVLFESFSPRSLLRQAGVPAQAQMPCGMG